MKKLRSVLIALFLCPPAIWGSGTMLDTVSQEKNREKNEQLVIEQTLRALTKQESSLFSSSNIGPIQQTHLSLHAGYGGAVSHALGQVKDCTNLSLRKLRIHFPNPASVKTLTKLVSLVDKQVTKLKFVFPVGMISNKTLLKKIKALGALKKVTHVSIQGGTKEMVEAVIEAFKNDQPVGNQIKSLIIRKYKEEAFSLRNFSKMVVNKSEKTPQKPRIKFIGCEFSTNVYDEIIASLPRSWVEDDKIRSHPFDIFSDNYNIKKVSQTLANHPDSSSVFPTPATWFFTFFCFAVSALLLKEVFDHLASRVETGLKPLQGLTGIVGALKEENTALRAVLLKLQSSVPVPPLTSTLTPGLNMAGPVQGAR